MAYSNKSKKSCKKGYVLDKSLGKYGRCRRRKTPGRKPKMRKLSVKSMRKSCKNRKLVFDRKLTTKYGGCRERKTQSRSRKRN